MADEDADSAFAIHCSEDTKLKFLTLKEAHSQLLGCELKHNDFLQVLFDAYFEKHPDFKPLAEKTIQMKAYVNKMVGKEKTKLGEAKGK